MKRSTTKIKSPLNKAALFTAMTLMSLQSFSAPGSHLADVDAGIVNQEKLVEMLVAGGHISATATGTEIDRALANYLSNHKNLQEPGQLANFERKREQRLANIANNTSNATSSQTQSQNALMLTNAWQGPVTQDKVLAILIEFPDYPANMVTPEETDNYYPDYDVPHYQDMLYGANGYLGSDGQTKTSMVQYYISQSGGSYHQYGDVTGWYQADFPAAYYGAAVGAANDINARDLVREALLKASADENVNLADYDLEDRYDLDGDGNLREADGLVDHLMIFHSGVGQEAGGGNLGTDAIWSHRWNLGSIFALEGTVATVPYWGGMMAAYDYTIQPIDAAAGVAAHEYAHDLGLPDEYDIVYGNDGFDKPPGEPVSYWSIMSAGSWAGIIPGTEPTGFSPWAKEFLQASLGGNWLHGKVVESEALTTTGQNFVLDQASEKGVNEDYVRVNLPAKNVHFMDPIGTHSYYSGRGDNLSNFTHMSVDLTGATSANLSFIINYDIETDWDYGRVLVNGLPIAGDITTTADPNGIGFGVGFTGQSNGWVSANFDLSAYAGEAIFVSFQYLTDGAVANNGYWFDELTVTADDQTVLYGDAETAVADIFFDGMTINNGSFEYEHYYLLEWRQHHAMDKGLAHINRFGGQIFSFDPGLVVWYVDTSFTDNGVASHPGEGWLGVVDGDRNPQVWSDGIPARSRYQVRDAAFNSKPGSYFHLTDDSGRTLSDPWVTGNPTFIDWEDYSNQLRPATGRLLPHEGLIFQVISQSADSTSATINVKKVW